MGSQGDTDFLAGSQLCLQGSAGQSFRDGMMC